LVTGVQTCALPISPLRASRCRRPARRGVVRWWVGPAPPRVRPAWPREERNESARRPGSLSGPHPLLAGRPGPAADRGRGRPGLRRGRGGAAGHGGQRPDGRPDLPRGGDQRHRVAVADHPAANHPAANHPAADEVLRSLLDPADRGSPYPYYHRLRELDPVHRSTAPGLGGAVVLTRYRDMERVMRSPRSYKDRRISPVYGAADDGPFSVMMRGLLPAADPPDHARRRGLLQKAFTPRALQQLEGHVVDVADGLLDGLRQQGPGADLVAHFAYQLPVIVICELLGVPVADRHRFV